MSCLTERTGFRIVILPIWRPKATLKVGWSRYIRCMICEQIDGYTYQSIDFGFLFVELSDYLSLLYCTAVSHFFAYTHTPPKQINQFHIVSSFIFQKTCNSGDALSLPLPHTLHHCHLKVVTAMVGTGYLRYPKLWQLLGRRLRRPFTMPFAADL